MESIVKYYRVLRPISKVLFTDTTYSREQKNILLNSPPKTPVWMVLTIMEAEIQII